MIRIQPNQIENPQQITAVVAGPDGANRLFVLDGQFLAQLGSWGQGQSKETYSVLLGPVLTRRQFVQASGTSALAAVMFNLNVGGGGLNVAWQIDSVDADWDDESGQVELRVEVSISCGGNGSAQLNKLGYHVTILAEM